MDIIEFMRLRLRILLAIVMYYTNLLRSFISRITSNKEERESKKENEHINLPSDVTIRSKPSSTATSRRSSISSIRNETQTPQKLVLQDVKTKKRKKGFAYRKVPLIPSKLVVKKVEQGQKENESETFLKLDSPKKTTSQVDFLEGLLIKYDEPKDLLKVEKMQLTIDTSHFTRDHSLFKYLELPQEALKVDKNAIKEAKICEQQQSTNINEQQIVPKKYKRGSGLYGIYLPVESEEELEVSSETSSEDEDLRKKETLLLATSDKLYEVFEDQRRNATRKHIDETIKEFQSMISAPVQNHAQIEEEIRNHIETISKNDAARISALIAENEDNQTRIRAQELKNLQDRLLRLKQREDAARRQQEEERARIEAERRAAEERERLAAEKEKQALQAQKEQQAQQAQQTAPKQPTGSTVPTTQPTQPVAPQSSPSDATKLAITLPPNVHTSIVAYVEAKRHLTTLTRVQQKIAQACTNTDIKKTITRTMNRFVGRLNSSLPAMNELINDILQFLTETQQKNRPYFEHALITLSEKLLGQMEITGSRDGYKSVYPAGILVVEVAVQFPEFLELLLALLNKRSKFTIPLFAVQAPNESLVSYRTRLGYSVFEGTQESETEFEDRMKGLLGFYAAITQSDDLSATVKNPYGPEYAWRWIASVLNMPPEPIAVEMLSVLLGITAYRLHEVYKGQFRKIIQYISNEYIPRIGNAPGMTRYVALLEVILLRYRNFISGRDNPEDPFKPAGRDLDKTSTGNFGKDL